MKPNPAEILQQIESGELLAAEAIRELDHNAILDARDSSPAFEDAWTDCHQRIEDAWPDADVSPEAATLAEDVRRESFLAVSRATSQHEIASYVSDDFDLIVRGAVLGLESAFLEQLWAAYLRHEVPTPSVD